MPSRCKIGSVSALQVQELAEDAKGESLLIREVLKLVPVLLGQAAPPLSHAGWQVCSLSHIRHTYDSQGPIPALAFREKAIWHE